MNINFINCIEPYDKVLDSIIEPIIKYLPRATKNIYFQEGMLNVCFFRELNIRNVAFMSHGIGDKGWRDGNKVKDFDYIFVSGPAWRTKLINQGVEEKKIYVNGFPKLDSMFNWEMIKHQDDKIHVLYAPTHNTNLENPKSISSYPRFLDYINYVPDNIELIVSAHPHNNDSNVITPEMFLWADVIISDCSSIIYEAFALDIPVVFPDWLVFENISKRCPGSFTHQIYEDNIGYHAENIEKLWEKVNLAAVRKTDKKTKDFIEGILPFSLRGVSGEISAMQLQHIANKE